MFGIFYPSQFYPYPIIKLTKPVTEEEVGNIDEPQEFTYKITGKCANDEGFESNIATVTILPVSVNIEEFIDENALQVNFTRLRKTLREFGLEERIETVRGQGYRLKEQVRL